MSEKPRQLNFTIVPGDATGTPRFYANFCAVAHTPFDVTLTFCEVVPLSESDIRNAQQDHVVQAPVRASVVLPVQLLPNLIGALQEQFRSFQESCVNPDAPRGPVN